MKCFIAAVLCAVCMVSFAYTDITCRFYFDTDKDTLNATQLSQLDSFISKTVLNDKYKEIYVTGNTDADGSNLYNMDLSMRRAQFITQKLLERRVPEKMIDRQYHGEENPVASNKTISGKSLNRRVEVVLRTYELNTVGDVIHELNGNPEQKRIIDNTVQSVVEGQNGIKIIFPPNCFVAADNKNFNPKNISVELVEVRTVQDALFSGVLSQTNTTPLETGGMFKLQVTADGRELKMKPGLQYTVQINNKNLKNNMSVYVPAPLSAGSGLIAWIDTKIPFKKDSTTDCEPPSIKLDPNIINNWTVTPKYEGLLDSYTFRLPQAPVKPVALRRPKDPAAPKRELVKYNAPWIKRLFMTKEAEQKKEEEIYEKQQAIYKKQHDNYLAKLEKYEEDSACMADAEQQYQQDLVRYEADMSKVAQELYDYKQATWEHALLSSFPALKKMLLYKNDHHLLHTNDLYSEVNNYLWTTSVYNKYNYEYLDRLHLYEDKFYGAMQKNIPGKDFTVYPPKSYAFGCGVGNWYSYYYYGYYIMRLQEDKTVAQHFAKAIDNYMQAQVDAGVFQPGNFTTFYQASLDKFEWVNCDRYQEYKKDDLITVQIPNYDMKDKNVYAIVKRDNSNYDIPLVNNQYVTTLPKNTEVIILAIGLDKNNAPLMAQTKFTTNKNEKITLNFKNVKVSEIKDAIQNI